MHSRQTLPVTIFSSPCADLKFKRSLSLSFSFFLSLSLSLSQKRKVNHALFQHLRSQGILNANETERNNLANFDQEEVQYEST